MVHRPENSGFTLIELLIVMALVGLLLGLSVPFVTSLRSDIALQHVLRQVKVDMISTLNYSLAGKSFAAISTNQLLNTALIPEAYGLYFEVSQGEKVQPPYSYRELSEENSFDESGLKITYQKSTDYAEPTVNLKSIILESLQNKTILEVKYASIIFIPPLGKILFSNQKIDQSLNFNFRESGDILENYDLIKLVFQYKDDMKNLRTLSFDKNKILTVF